MTARRPSALTFTTAPHTRRPPTLGAPRLRGAKGPTPPELYLDHGLGPLPRNTETSTLYLDLVKRALTNILYEDVPSWIFDRAANKISAAAQFDLGKRVNGDDGPTTAHTMIGIRRLENIQRCVEDVLEHQVPGDLVETGVLAGGATIFMRAILKAYNDTQRRVFVCDSFIRQPSTMPPKVARWAIKAAASVPNKEWQRQFFHILQALNPAKSFPHVAQPSDELVDFVMQILQNGDRMALPTHDTSLEGVKSNFARYGLFDDQVVFVKGYFSETLPQLETDAFALIRLDGDVFESTMDALESLYPKLSPGGYCIIDDFYTFSDCRKGVEDYRRRHGVADPIEIVDEHAVFWRKS